MANTVKDAATIAKILAKRYRTHSFDEKELAVQPGQSGFAERAYKEKARGPVNINTIGQEVEKPRISDAKRGDQNALLNALMNRRSKLTAKSSSPTNRYSEQLPAGPETDPLEKSQEGMPPRLDDDPRLQEQRQRVLEARDLQSRVVAGKTPATSNDAELVNRLVQQEETTYQGLLRELLMHEGLR